MGIFVGQSNLPYCFKLRLEIRIFNLELQNYELEQRKYCYLFDNMLKYI